MDRFERDYEEGTLHLLDNDGDYLIENATVDDVRYVDRNAEILAKIKLDHPKFWEYVGEQLHEVNSESQASKTHQVKNKKQATLFDILEDADIASRYNNQYHIFDEERLEILTEQYDSMNSYGSTTPELIGLLKASSEDGVTPTQTKLRNTEGLPSEIPFNSNFDGLNNAAWYAGLEPSRMQLGDEEYLDLLRLKFYEDGEPASAREIDDDPRLPSSTQYRNRFEKMNNAATEAGMGAEKVLKKQMKELGDYDSDRFLDNGIGLHPEKVLRPVEPPVLNPQPITPVQEDIAEADITRTSLNNTWVLEEIIDEIENRGTAYYSVTENALSAPRKKGRGSRSTRGKVLSELEPLGATEQFSQRNHRILKDKVWYEEVKDELDRLARLEELEETFPRPL